MQIHSTTLPTRGRLIECTSAVTKSIVLRFGRDSQHHRRRLVAQLQFERVCERPPRSLRSRLPLTRGRLHILPLVRGRAAEGGRGSLTHHFESELATSAGGTLRSARC